MPEPCQHPISPAWMFIGPNPLEEIFPHAHFMRIPWYRGSYHTTFDPPSIRGEIHRLRWEENIGWPQQKSDSSIVTSSRSSFRALPKDQLFFPTWNIGTGAGCSVPDGGLLLTLDAEPWTTSMLNARQSTTSSRLFLTAGRCSRTSDQHQYPLLSSPPIPFSRNSTR